MNIKTILEFKSDKMFLNFRNVNESKIIGLSNLKLIKFDNLSRITVSWKHKFKNQVPHHSALFSKVSFSKNPREKLETLSTN